MSWMAGPKNADKFKEAAPSAMDKAKAAAEKFADRFRKKPLAEPCEPTTDLRLCPVLRQL